MKKRNFRACSLGPPRLVQQDGHNQIMTQVLEVQQSSDDTLDLFLYDSIRGDSYDWWNDEVIESETSANWFKKQLDDAPNVTQINLFVNSPGGYVSEAMGIRAHLLRHPANKTGYVDGTAASAATFILTSCDKIHMLTGSMQMIHDMWTFAIGNANDLRKIADDMDKMMEGNRQIYLERAGDKLTEEKLKELMNAETYLTATECVELGLADEVLASKEYKNITQQRQHLQMLQTVPPEEAAPEPESEPEPPAEIKEEPPEEKPAEPQAEKQPVNLLAAMIAAAERKEK